MVDLKKIPSDDLENELHRRRRWREDHTPRPIPYCDECSHFAAYTGGMDMMQNDYNPCQRGHKMNFRMPDGPTTHDWGFYRIGCKDRELTPSPQQEGSK